MNIQEEPLRNALNAAYAQISRSGSMMPKSEVLAIVESIQLAVIPLQEEGRMTESLVERVARVLCECEGHHPDEQVTMFSKPSGRGFRWEFFAGRARHAIAAMREHFKQQPEYHWAAIESIDEALK